MSHPVKGVDHCFVLVDDLERSAEQYRALGFTLAPLGLHSKAKGSANYTIMFPDDYFELLGLLQPTPLNEALRAALTDSGQGLHAIACRIGTAEDAAKALTELEIATHGLGSFERPVDLPNGGKGVAAFSTLSFDKSEVPMGSVFMCQHKTPETVWLPELLTHANTACGLDAILIVTDKPNEDAKRYARLWAEGEVVPSTEGYTVHTGSNSAPLKLITAEQMSACYPDMDLSHAPTGVFSGLQIKVKDLDAATRCLENADTPSIKTERGLAVAPQYASGVVLEFVSA